MYSALKVTKDFSLHSSITTQYILCLKQRANKSRRMSTLDVLNMVPAENPTSRQTIARARFENVTDLNALTSLGLMQNSYAHSHHALFMRQAVTLKYY
jgi:hypothetical protein